jgi:hypothetical protein
MKYKVSRSTLTLVGVGVVGLVFGYFTGREHLKYELRSALQSAQEGIASAFGGHLNGVRSESKKNIPAPKVVKEPEPISVVLIKKSNRKGDFRNSVITTCTFNNLTSKDIRAFEGSLGYTDILDNNILTSRVVITTPLKVNESMEWSGSLDCNPFMDDHQKLRNTEQEDLKIIFTVKKILFADGTTKEYDD